MQEAHMTNGMSLAGSTLRLPVQSMPINRSITGSTLSGDSGVQPQIFLAILAGLALAWGVAAVGAGIAYGAAQLARR